MSEENLDATSSCAPPSRHMRRLGVQHFAHLRAVAEGLDLADSAKRYLGIEHGHQARGAHLETIDRVRAIARRRGEIAWRLIGLTIRVGAGGGPRPSLEDFIAERGLDGWSEQEVSLMYAEAYPVDPKLARRRRLRERQLDLLHRLETVAAERAHPSDPVGAWFDEATAARLVTAGMINLGELAARIAVGGRWWRALPAIGEAKAQRIAAQMATLLPQALPATKTLFALAPPGTLASDLPVVAQAVRVPVPVAGPAVLAAALPTVQPASLIDALPPEAATVAAPPGAGMATAAPLLAARSDQEAVEAWIRARAGSVATVKAYRREALRLLLWLHHERGGITLSAMGVDDCGDYMAFLQHIPPRWISRERAAPGQPGWAPFRGKLSHDSRRQAVVIIAAMFTWLNAARYLGANPWMLLNQKTGDDPEKKLLDSKALSEAASAELLAFIERQPPSPSRLRIAFIVRFMEAVGLRSAELLTTRLGDIRREPEGWVMQVRGKGARNRVVALPGQSFAALQAYLASRGLGGIETAPPDAPLLASTGDPLTPIGYQALYKHVKGWIARAITASLLPAHERQRLAGATTHWLRHTFGTRAMAREVPLDVIQAQMGHASIQTTTAIYGRAPIKRRVDELDKAFR